MIVLDTNVVSELMRPAPVQSVADWVRAQSGADMYTTSITLAEIGYGIERLPEGRRKRLLHAASLQIFGAFADHVLPFDAAAAVEYPAIVNSRERSGAPMDGFDAQIASVCRAHRATVATRNGKDFHDVGINVIDPWSAN